MNNQGTKPQNHQGARSPAVSKPQLRKSFKETDDFQHFQKLLNSGFVVPGTELTNPDLLKFSEKLAKLLRKTERREADTVNQFRKFFTQVQGLKHFHDVVQLQVTLRMLRARMLYAAGRKTISRDFCLVIQESLDHLLAHEDLVGQLSGVCGFFESLYAYYYYQAQKDVRKRRE